MEGVVENAGELVSWATDKYFDSGWERSRKFINGKKVESVYRPLPAVAREQQQQQQQRAKSEAARSKHASASASSASSQDPRERQSAASKGRRRCPSPSRLRSPDDDRGVGRTAQSRPPPPPPPPSNYYPDPVSAERRGNTAAPKAQVAILPASRRKQANLLFPARTDFFTDDHANSTALVKRLNEDNDEFLRAYEAEKDDPPRNPASVLPEKDLWTLAKYDGESKKKHVDKSEKKSSKQPSTTGSRRDSAMASRYSDDYRGNTQYPGEARARSAQPPPRHRYDDDDDSDYDERSGRRDRGGGRGYSDRDRDDGDYYEVHERYRGPVSAGPLVPANRPSATERRESYRSSYNDGPYAGGAGTIARRSDPYLDRSQVSRRSRRDRDDYDDSRSRSRSRDSRSRSGGREAGAGGEGIKQKITSQFDTSQRGLGVGLAGALAGGLAGRQFGKQHRQRDIILGAVVGGLVANAAENKWSEHRKEKEREEEYHRYEGRSRSTGR